MGKTNGANGRLGVIMWAVAVSVPVLALVGSGYVTFDNHRAAVHAAALTKHAEDIASTKAVVTRVEVAIQRNADKLDRLLERQ